MCVFSHGDLFLGMAYNFLFIIIIIIIIINLQSVEFFMLEPRCFCTMENSFINRIFLCHFWGFTSYGPIYIYSQCGVSIPYVWIWNSYLPWNSYCGAGLCIQYTLSGHIHSLGKIMIPYSFPRVIEKFSSLHLIDRKMLDNC